MKSKIKKRLKKRKLLYLLTLLTICVPCVKTAWAALLSREEEPLNVRYTVRPQPDKDRNLLISYESKEFDGTFILRQQKPASNGMLMSVPEPLDMRILRIISRENIRTLQDYALWLKKNFQYQKDQGKDSWATPDQTLDLQKGDCEDFAFLNQAVLRLFGYNSQVLGLGGGSNLVNHAICVFKKGSQYFWFDNTTLKTTDISSFQEFGTAVLKFSGYGYIFEVNKGRLKILSDGL